jgi:hypothetical protein
MRKMMVMGINSIVDYPASIAALCFRPVSRRQEFDFLGKEIGFGVRARPAAPGGTAGFRGKSLRKDRF